MGHIPREIRRFCSFFLNSIVALEGRVRFLDNKYRRSPILKGGLELPICQVKYGTNISFFSRRKEFVDEYYVELEKMTDLLPDLKPRREWLMIIWINMALKKRTRWN